jgi:hypothetical protein
VSAAGSAAVRPSGEVATAGGHRPHRTSGQPEPSLSGRPPTVNPPGCRTPHSRTSAPQRRRCSWPSCGTGSDADRRCGTGRGHLLSAARPADRSVSTGTTTSGHDRRGCGRRAAAVPSRRQHGTGYRTPDRSRSQLAWTPCPPARRRGRTGQDAASSGRSIRRLLAAAQPPLAPTRYNFLYILRGRPCGRPPAAAVLGRLHHTTGSAYRSHRRDAPRSQRSRHRDAQGRNEEALSRRG